MNITGRVAMSKKGKWFADMVKLTSECKNFRRSLDELQEEDN
tara:strand:+ start:474 stop:599 length:126 start_codon:yes stop_codon:yes gene_type:complete